MYIYVRGHTYYSNLGQEKGPTVGINIDPTPDLTKAELLRLVNDLLTIYHEWPSH